MPGHRFEQRSDLYMIFVSIIFGIFIAVWLEPVVKLFSPTESFAEIFEVIQTRAVLRGVLVFLMLIGLWWWYAWFLGHIDPSQTLWMFAVDFITLGAFAMGFRFWAHVQIFPIVVFVAAGLMLGRFSAAIKSTNSRSKERWALVLAVATLGIYAFGAGMAAAGSIFIYDGSDEMWNKIWNWIDYGVMGLLFLGVVATALAAIKTEGMTWRKPLPLVRKA